MTSSSENRVLPQQQATEIEMWVDGRIRDAARWENVELLDENGVFTLHRLAASIYAAGFEAGERFTGERMRAAFRRSSEERIDASG